MFQILVGPFDEDYATPSASFVSTFEMGILGFVDRTQFNETQSPVLTMMLLVMLVLVVFIIALVSFDLDKGLDHSIVVTNAMATEWIHCSAWRVLRKSCASPRCKQTISKGNVSECPVS